MKKMLFSLIVGLASLGMGAATSQAGTFGLFVCGGGCGDCGGCGHKCCLFHHCCSKCCSTICVRDYNAFSPSFCGNMTFNGCNPFCGGGCGAGNPGYGAGNPGCGPSIQMLPACSGCAPESCGPEGIPSPGAQAMPYGGPLQSAAMAQQYPQSVMPMSVQPNYWTAGYGR